MLSIFVHVCPTLGPYRPGSKRTHSSAFGAKFPARSGQNRRVVVGNREALPPHCPGAPVSVGSNPNSKPIWGMAVLDPNDYEARRDELRQRYMQAEGSEGEPVITAGVHHLVLISSDLDATLRFYTEVLRMRLTKLVPNRDEPTSTHKFLDMGGGNLLAFFDFPEHQATPTVRGLGSMHHVP